MVIDVECIHSNTYQIEKINKLVRQSFMLKSGGKSL